MRDSKEKTKIGQQVWFKLSQNSLRKEKSKINEQFRSNFYFWEQKEIPFFKTTKEKTALASVPASNSAFRFQIIEFRTKLNLVTRGSVPPGSHKPSSLKKCKNKGTEANQLQSEGSWRTKLCKLSEKLQFVKLSAANIPFAVLCP